MRKIIIRQKNSRKGARATMIMDDVSNSNSKYIGNGVSIELC